LGTNEAQSHLLAQPLTIKVFLSKDDVCVGLDKAKEKGVLFRLPLSKAARTMTAK
jgi:hypothetical protein